MNTPSNESLQKVLMTVSSRKLIIEDMISKVCRLNTCKTSISLARKNNDLPYNVSYNLVELSHKYTTRTSRE